MELFDVYDKSCRKLNKTIRRGIDKLLTDEYHLAVDICIINSKNEFLLQKRSANKTIYPNLWGFTGGSAVAGESSREAIIRETREEIGLDISQDKLELITQYITRNVIVDVYMLNKDINLAELSLQKEEVGDVSWLSRDKIEEFINKSQIMPTILPGLQKCIEQNYVYKTKIY